jgi:hypothetical protein
MALGPTFPLPSFRRKPESIVGYRDVEKWIPAFAGMTTRKETEGISNAIAPLAGASQSRMAPASQSFSFVIPAESGNPWLPQARWRNGFPLSRE